MEPESGYQLLFIFRLGEATIAVIEEKLDWFLGIREKIN